MTPTVTPTVTPTTLPALLAARASVEPDRVALIVPGAGTGDPALGELTFGEWETRSGAVAAGLPGRGLRRGDRVGLLFGGESWIDYAVTFLGVLKAGGVAVPLSAWLAPAEVSDLMARCSAAGLVHEPGSTPPAVPGWTATPGSLGLSPRSLAPDAPAPAAGDLAQIIYTSGTTGTPKGVAASHANLAYGQRPDPPQRRYAHSEHLLHAFPIGTNAGQMMLVDALVAHPAVIAVPRFEAELFGRLIEAYGVGTVFLVPSMAIDLLNAGVHDRRDLSSVQLLSSSAAALPAPVALSLADAFPNATIVNYYTSTEAVPAQTTMIVDPDRPASVGRPGDGELMIADKAGRRLPAGETGEVWLRSPGAPRSYFGDPRAGAEVFRNGWVRMGDLGYLDEEGYLFLVDRESDVIKSGGLKVSTLQVETALYEHPAVAEAAVLGVPHPVMGMVPAAAVVAREPVSPAELRGFLTGRLARHEVPARVLVVESLPRNDNGKVVKRELRTLFAEHISGPLPGRREGRPPATPDETTLAEIWATLLGARDVTADDDFFALGGDSMKATQLASLASDAFGAELGPSLAFDAPVLADQALRVRAATPRHSGANPEPRPTAASGNATPLSSLQAYFLRWMYETPEPRAVSAVNVALRIRDELDMPALRRALDLLVARHESLRTVFPSSTVFPSPTVFPGSAAPVPREVLPECPPDVVELWARDEAEGEAIAVRELERPFDVTTGPLTRLVVAHLGPTPIETDDHVVVLAVHHLVSDGWSMAVLLRELGLAYSGSPLPPQATTCADVYARASARWPEARPYWHKVLDGAPPALTAPRRPADRFTGTSIPVRLPAGLSVRLAARARRDGASVSMALLAAWAEVLREWTGSDDLVFLSPVPGRVRPEDDVLVGCLVQPLLLRVDASGRPPYGELLRRVRAAVLDAAEHQFYPYEEFSRLIPHPAWFRFESWGGPAHFPGLESGPFELPRELMFDWALPPGEADLSVPELAVSEGPDGSLTGWLVYNRRAYDRPEVERLAQNLLARLEHIHDA
ncbi:AMP-binding protein [Planotetraspora sp. GP83]|uniref:AMP-binding protein n=1 Tax=Planotetraspora sp. GP83 TaxID=3156264 RepID=UPI003519D754